MIMKGSCTAKCSAPHNKLWYMRPVTTGMARTCSRWQLPLKICVFVKGKHKSNLGFFLHLCLFYRQTLLHSQA
jgi:hypothetical protein